MTRPAFPPARQHETEPAKSAEKSLSVLEIRFVAKAFDTLEAMTVLTDDLELAPYAADRTARRETLSLLCELAEEMAVNLGFFGYDAIMNAAAAIIGAGRGADKNPQAALAAVRRALADIETELRGAPGKERPTGLIARI